MKFPDIKAPKRSYTSANTRSRHHMHLRGLFYDSLIENLKEATQESKSYFEEQPSINYDWGFESRPEAKYESSPILKYKQLARIKPTEPDEEVRKTITTPLFGKPRARSPQKKKEQARVAKVSEDLSDIREYYSKPKENTVGLKIDPYETVRSIEGGLGHMTFSPRKRETSEERAVAGKEGVEQRPSMTNLHRLRGESLVKLLNKYRAHSENKKAVFLKQQERVKVQKE